MQNGYVAVLAAVLLVRNSRFAGAGETEYACDKCSSIRQVVTLLTAVAGAEPVSVGDAPSESKRALLMLAEITHT